jgi:hypothetical protein
LPSFNRLGSGRLVPSITDSRTVLAAVYGTLLLKLFFALADAIRWSAFLPVFPYFCVTSLKAAGAARRRCL